MRKLFCLLTFSVFVLTASATGDPIASGAQARAMGGASLTLNGVWASMQNQAAMLGINGFAAGVSYDNRFLVSELSSANLVIAKSFGDGVFGLNFSRYGYSAYREQKLGFGYARRLSENFNIGVQIDYLQVALGNGYGSAGKLTWEGGVLYKVNDNISLAAHIFNPIRVQLAEFNDERIPAILRFGGNYRFSERVLLTAQLDKSIDYDVIVGAGLEYMVVNDIFVRAGVSGGNSLFSFGAGYRFKGFQIDIATSYHQVLGFSPQLGLTYNGR